MMSDRDGDAPNAGSPDERVKRLSEERRKLFEAVSGNSDLLRKIRAERGRGAEQRAPDSVEAAGFGPPDQEPASPPPPPNNNEPRAKQASAGAPPFAHDERADGRRAPWSGGAPWNANANANANAGAAFGEAGERARAFWQAAAQGFGAGPGQGFPGAQGFMGGAPFSGNLWRFMQQAQQALGGGVPPWGGASPWGGAGPWSGAASPWGGASSWGGGAAPWSQSHGAPPYGAAGAPPKPPWTPLVPMKPFGSKRPLFCVHAVLGSAFPYQQLAVHLDQNQPVYGIQSRGLDGSEEPIDDVEKMASAYVDAIRVVQPKGPYKLAGYSFGGAVALAMAQKLVRDGDRVAVLAMLGTGAPLSAASPTMAQLASLMAGYLSDLRKLAVNAFLAENPWAAREGAMPRGVESLLSPMQRVAITNQIAALRYLPRPYAGDVDLFVTKDQQAMAPLDPTFGWSKICAGRIDTEVIDGSHLSILQEPQVGVLAKKLTEVLDRAS